MEIKNRLKGTKTYIDHDSIDHIQRKEEQRNSMEKGTRI